MPIDLHLHSTHSDGTLTPAEIIARAKSLGLTAVALTDHNTVSGVPAFLSEAEKQGVTAVAGTELSTVYKGKEIHLLGLFIPSEAFPAVTALTEDYLTRKEQSNRDLVARLAADGYRVNYDTIRNATPDGNINRALIAKALLAGGYVPSVKAAFDTLLGEGMGYYIPPERLDLFAAIRFLREQVMQDEHAAGRDLHDEQALGLFALEGQNDETHGDQAQDLSDNGQGIHMRLLVLRLNFIITQKIDFVKGNSPNFPGAH